MKKYFTGWYETELCDLWIENGLVVRGATRGAGTKTVHPYKRSRPPISLAARS